VRSPKLPIGLYYGIKTGNIIAMSKTITVDRLGRIVLPKEVRERLQLRAHSRLELTVVADRIELRPLSEDDDLKLVQKGRRVVLAGFDPDPSSGVRVREERESRLVRLAERVRRGK
jgi:AbrB family looped-hinge helix DNA binding protein